MPKAALSKISQRQLVGELNKWKAKLVEMIAQRDSLNEQIAEVDALATEPAAMGGRQMGNPGLNT